MFQVATNLRFTSSLSISFVTLLALVALFIYAFVKYQCKQDPREPPYLRHAIPFVGNLIGMMRWGAKWYWIVKSVFADNLFRRRR